MRLVLVGTLIVSSMVSSVACVELPAGFEAAAPIEVVQHDCNSSSVEAEPPSLMAAASVDNEVIGTLRNASFLCSTQVCAYAVEQDGVARVLFQPCDMHPFQEALCSCSSDIDFVAPFGADVELVGAEAWTRGAHVDEDAALLDDVDF